MTKRQQLVFLLVVTAVFIASLSAQVKGPSIADAAPDLSAFTFTAWQLNLQFDLSAESLGVRGKVSVRNDSHSAQTLIPLQISSQFRWASIRASESKGDPQFSSHMLDSDIDHTGKINEAVVRLGSPLAPGATADLDVAYYGRVLDDSERLERLGTPPEIARHSDWDQITHEAAFLRGVGYVTWFPVSIEPVVLGTGPELIKRLNAWKLRHTSSSMNLKITVQGRPDDTSGRFIFVNGNVLPEEKTSDPALEKPVESRDLLGFDAPTIALANFQRLAGHSATIYYLPGDGQLAEKCSQSANNVAALLEEWFGEKQLRPFQVIELQHPSDSPFQYGASLLSPLTEPSGAEVPLLTYSMAHAYFVSPRLWMQEGVPWFLEAVERERQEGREAAFARLEEWRAALSLAEPDLSSGEPPADDNLIVANDEVRYRNKSVFVWWMLRDLAGQDALQRALRAYRPEDDRDPAYFEKLLEGESQKNLKWFFDDWVYHDRGLPQLRVDSTFARKQPDGEYLVTLTVTNTGRATVEAPVVVHANAGDTSQRTLIPGGKQAVVRLKVNGVPTQATVNDGSVPEPDPSADSVTIRLSEENAAGDK